MSEITLSNPLNVVIQPEVKKSFTKINIERIVDRNKEKKVVAFLAEIPREILLWEGAAYDSIGDWTQTQAEARILEVLNS